MDQPICSGLVEGSLYTGTLLFGCIAGCRQRLISHRNYAVRECKPHVLQIVCSNTFGSSGAVHQRRWSSAVSVPDLEVTTPSNPKPPDTVFTQTAQFPIDDVYGSHLREL